MICRQLPPSEWNRLVGTELEASYQRLNPAWAVVLVVEDEAGAIVGCWALLTVRHVEGLWIHPDHRGRGRVAARLWTAMRRLVHASGGSAVMTAAVTSEVEALLQRKGATVLPGTHWVLPMQKEQHVCQP